MTEEGLTILEGLARRGLTEKQIAENIGVAYSTLNEWKKRFPEITEALKKDKEYYDDKVEKTLLECATGQFKTKTEVTKWRIDEVTGQPVVYEGTTTKTQQPPNTAALIFWLKNRRPDLWRDNPLKDKEQKGGYTGPMVNIIADIPKGGESDE